MRHLLHSKHSPREAANLNTWKVKTDGGCPANPGPGAWAFVIEGQDTNIERAGFLPPITTTNNQAEYRAVTAAALFLTHFGGETKLPDRIEFWSDSQLIVNQINGTWGVHDAVLRPFSVQAVEAIRQLRQTGPKVTINWFRREHNTRADELCNAVLRKNGVVLKSK